MACTEPQCLYKGPLNILVKYVKVYVRSNTKTFERGEGFRFNVLDRGLGGREDDVAECKDMIKSHRCTVHFVKSLQL